MKEKGIDQELQIAVSGWVVAIIFAAVIWKFPTWVTKLAFGMDHYEDVSVKTARRCLWQNALFQFVWASICYGGLTVVCILWARYIFSDLAKYLKSSSCRNINPAGSS